MNWSNDIKLSFFFTNTSWQVSHIVSANQDLVMWQYQRGDSISFYAYLYTVSYFGSNWWLLDFLHDCMMVQIFSFDAFTILSPSHYVSYVPLVFCFVLSVPNYVACFWSMCSSPPFPCLIFFRDNANELSVTGTESLSCEVILTSQLDISQHPEVRNVQYPHI